MSAPYLTTTVADLPADLRPLLDRSRLCEEEAKALLGSGAFQIMPYWVGGRGHVAFLEPAYRHQEGPCWRRSGPRWVR